jgi:hypothetical protein
MSSRSRKTRLAATALGLALCAAGCGTTYMEVHPERLYEQRPWEPVRARRVGSLDVRKSGFSLFVVPLSIPNMASSIDAAIQDAGADAVADLELETRQYGALIFSWTTYIARGDLVVLEGGESDAAPGAPAAP